MKKNTKRVGIVGGVVATLIGGGVAFAAFTTTGTVSAAGHVAAAPSAINATGTIGDLYPGGCSDVTVTFTNNNDHAATIDTSKYASIWNSLDVAGDSFAALQPNYGQLTFPDGTTIVVPKHGTKSVTVGNLVCLSGSADNDDAGSDVSLSGTVPFSMANDTEYAG